MAFYAHPTDTSPYIYYAGGNNDFREMVIALVNGCDISFIDPQLYDNLLPYIDQYILKFQDRGDHSSIDRLNFCVDYIKGYPERERIARILTKKKRGTSQKDLPFNQSQLDNEIDNLLNSGKITKTDDSEYSLKEIEQITSEMRTRRLRCAEDEDFDRADQYAIISSKLTARGEYNLIKKIHTERAEDISQKLRDAKASYSNLKQRWDDIEVNFKKHTENELEEMIEAQKAEKANFEKKKDDPIPPKYKKYSNEYLNLKMEEKKLVASKRFEEAAIAQQRVREQKQKEDKMMLIQWHQRVQEDLKKLNKKHEQQLRSRQMNINREKNDIQKSKKKELSALKNKIQFLEEQLRQIEESGYYVPKQTQEEDNQEQNCEEEIKEQIKEEPHQEEEKRPNVVAIEDTSNVMVFFTENKAIPNKEEEEINEDENFPVHPPEEESEKSHRRINRTKSSNPDDENHNEEESNQENLNNEEEDNKTDDENKEEETNNEDNNQQEQKEIDNIENENQEKDENENKEENELIDNEEENQNENHDDKQIENEKTGNDEEESQNENQESDNNKQIENEEIQNNEEQNQNENQENENNDDKQIKNEEIRNNEEENQESENNDDKQTENERLRNNEEESQNEEQTFPVHPPAPRQIDQNNNNEESHECNNEQTNDANANKQKPKQPKWKSNGISSNQYQSLPRLNTNQRNRLQKSKKSGPEAFRQRALLNKQLYCAKTLLERKEQNQKKEQREQMRKREASLRDSS